MTEQLKVRIRWSDYRIPGFRRAPDGRGFAPCYTCFEESEGRKECEHDSQN